MPTTTELPEIQQEPAAAANVQWAPGRQATSTVLKASMWTMGGFGVGQVVRMGGNIVLAHLLNQAAFGIMLVVNILIRGLTMFSDLGIGVSIIQHRRGDDPAFYNTAWSVQAVRGVVLWLGACLLAWPAARFYDMPQLLWLIPIVGLTAVISGFDSTSLWSMQRHLRLRDFTFVEFSAQIVGMATMICWALASPTVVALAAGAIAADLFKLGVSHAVGGDVRNRFGWEKEALHALIHFGKWIFISTLVFFCAEQVDRLVLPKFISAADLGVYGFGFAIGYLPVTLMGRFAGMAINPHLAQIFRREPDDLGQGLLAARAVLLPTAIILILGVLLESGSFFALLYPAEYHNAGPIAQWLCGWAWVMIVNQTLNGALIAVGDSRSLAAHNFATLVATAILSIVGYSLAGLEGFIAGMAGGAAIGYVVMQICLRGHGMGTFRQDLIFSLLMAAVAVGSLLILRPLGVNAFGPDQWVRIPILLVVGLWALVRLRGLAKLQ